MTPEQEANIRELARLHADAAMNYQMQQMCNVAGDSKARVQQQVEYAVAMAREMETRAALDRAMAEIARK